MPNPNQSTLLGQFVKTFDTVLPGYARAWNEALCKVHEDFPGTWSTMSWESGRRTRLNARHDRCVLIYVVRYLERRDPDYRRYATVLPPDDFPFPAILILNRGYVPLCLNAFDNPEQAFKTLRTNADSDPRARQEDQGIWLYSDHTPFAQRCATTLDVLDYLGQYATRTLPLWHHTPNLARQS